ncbi:hypothetical protein A8924_7120 [Saccharopolyspora erythraea NRRL 2338]|nr:hypothetical protein N599_31460 [Saccharopolyspora erythraea D]PFG99570.1 hypothetical protein A8924_7120 [Saccharopolyspora erythraea NRRL 2338]
MNPARAGRARARHAPRLAVRGRATEVPAAPLAAVPLGVAEVP